MAQIYKAGNTMQRWQKFMEMGVPILVGSTSEAVFLYCISFVFLHKSSKTEWLKTAHVYHLTASVRQQSRHGCAGFSARGLTRLQRCQSMLASHLKFGILVQAHAIIGRVHLLAAVDSLWLTSSRPTGEIL